MNACACMGPMYDEPHCICMMEQLGLPLNTAVRQVEYAKASAQLAELFGPGGIFHKEQK